MTDNQPSGQFQTVSWPLAWMHEPALQQLIAALGAGNARFVGGAVRDSLLGLPVADIDIATPLKPTDVVTRLQEQGIKTIPTGLKHGTVTALVGAETYEITTLRIDEHADGRHADVCFTDDWYLDAARRDFTINAIYALPDGTLFDPFDGIGDIKEKSVRFIGDAAARIAEDALRILRFYRFSARYADSLDVDGQVACTENKGLIAILSVERVRTEMIKILTVPDPSTILEAMNASGVLAEIFKAGYELAPLLGHLTSPSPHQSEPLTRLWWLLKAAYRAEQIATFLKMSAKEKRRLENLEAIFFAKPDLSSAVDVRRAIYKFSATAVREYSLLCAAPESKAEVLHVCSTWQRPVFPLSGKDIMVLGVEEGARIGAILSALEQEWIDSDFHLSKQKLASRITCYLNV